MAHTRPDVLQRLRQVRLLAMDVDGVLTDGSIILSPYGEIKRFCVRDGMGLKLAAEAGYSVVWITARCSDAVRERARELGCVQLLDGVHDKAQALKEAASAARVKLEHTAYMGDDLNDLPAMEICGCPLAPADAVPAVRAAACYVTTATGGHGAVREVCDLLLLAATMQQRTADGTKGPEREAFESPRSD